MLTGLFYVGALLGISKRRGAPKFTLFLMSIQRADVMKTAMSWGLSKARPAGLTSTPVGGARRSPTSPLPCAPHALHWALDVSALQGCRAASPM